MRVRHLKHSTVPDAGDNKLVQPSDWNADHIIEDIQISDVMNLQAVLDGKLGVGDVISGADGKSAYQLALEAGYVGTLEEWLQSLVGPVGKSAYQLALEQGYVGDIDQWLDSLKASIEVTALDAGKVLTNDGTTASWSSIGDVEGFDTAVEDALTTIVVDQGDI